MQGFENNEGIQQVQEILQSIAVIHSVDASQAWKKDWFQFDYPHGCYGVISLGATSSINKGDPQTAYIVYIEVPEKFRKNGIGKKIIAEMIEFAKSKGKTEITARPTSTEGQILFDSASKNDSSFGSPN